MSNAILEDLNTLTAANLMSSDPLTVYEGWSVKSLANFFVRHHISGAPVVASDNELVGVVSQSDLVKFEATESTDSEIDKLIRTYCGPYGPELSSDEKEKIKKRAHEHTTVNVIMTPVVVSVDISTSAKVICETLVKQDIHRLFVLANGKLVGVISAMDVLRKMLEN